MFSSAEGCPEDRPGLPEQEQFFQTAVGHAATYDVTEATLKLLDEEGTVTVRLEREPEFDMNSEDLIGTSWLLVRLAGESPPDDAGITLAFESSTALSGNAGCRGYAGAYTAEDDGIQVSILELQSTECARGEEYLLLEGQYTTVLGWARRYVLDGEALTIFDRAGNVLEFVRHAE
jgi:heat shock protein HslJ